MGKRFASLFVILIILSIATGASGASANKSIKSAPKGGEYPPAEMQHRKVYVITDGGVGYDLKLTLVEFVAALKKNNKDLATKWKKVNDHFWVYNTSGIDPMSEKATKVNFGFQTVADNREYVLLTALNMNGVAASQNEIVAFGLVIAREHNPDYSEE